MIIGNNFIFLHIPKTGGSSFCRMMLKRHGLEEWGDPHSTARDIPHELRSTHFIFGFMRDPVKQAKSNFIYHTRSWGEHFDMSMTFEQWCEWRWDGTKDQEWASKWIHRPQDLHYGYHMNVRPSAGFFCDEDGNCIADHIYRFEDMAESTAAISDRIGINCDISDFNILKYNKGPDRQAVVTNKCVELLRYAKTIDFVLYNTSGDVGTNYRCRTVPNYAYARP